MTEHGKWLVRSPFVLLIYVLASPAILLGALWVFAWVGFSMGKDAAGLVIDMICGKQKPKAK